MSYEDKIERGLILWLREVHGIKANSAHINESEVEREWFSGCKNCGHCNDTIRTEIVYTKENSDWRDSHYINGSGIDFLPTLLEYIERAN